LKAFTAVADTALDGGGSLYEQLRQSKTAKKLAQRKTAARDFIASEVTPFLNDVKDLIQNDVKPLLTDVKEIIKDETQPLRDEVKDIVAEEVKPRLHDLKDRVKSYTERASTWLAEQDSPAITAIRQQSKRLGHSFADLEERYQLAIKTRIDPLFLGKRHAMLQQLQSQDKEELTLTPEERRINRNLMLAGVVTGAAVATAPIGGVVSFVACVPLAMYLIRHIVRWAYQSVVEERRLTIPVLMTTNQLLMWFGGFYTIGGVVFIFTFAGQKLGYITERQSHKQLSDVFGKLPAKVWVLGDGVEKEIPFEQLQVGDVLVARAGQTIPIDGVIIDGYASIDQHRLTGEAQPAEKGIGDAVLASTVVLAGRVQVRVEKSGEGTLAAQIGEMLSKTASFEMALTTRARRMADASVIPTLTAAGLAWAVIGLSSAVAITSTMFGLNLLICGPTALRNYLSVAARRKILIKDGRSLDLLTDIDTVVFDKTGTLTLDQPHVADVHSFSEVSSLEILRYAAAVEQRQSHPIARAILAHAQERKITLPEINDARFEMGYGLRAEIELRLIRVGSDRFMTLEQIALPTEVQVLEKACHEQGDSLVMVAVDGRLAGAIELKPTIRPEARAVIDELRRRKLDFCIISGDQEGPTRTLAQTLGISRYFANTLPENKARLVEQLQQEGRAVCFVGDGINDSIALKKANVSVSLHGATTVAMDTAQVVLMDTTLEQLPMLFQLAEEMERNLKTARTLAIVPSMGIWAGVFFLHLGILGAAVIFEASLWTGIANATRPLLKYKEDDVATN
jgi:Cu2+-exporting ATPase